MKAPRRRRNGFTLIELLVVIVIIALLVALILPAVQSARESARRMKCKNNIKQLVLALHNYHDVHRVFPLNYGRGPYTNENRGASWMQFVLPYLEQNPMYSRIQFGGPLSAPANTAVAETSIPAFHCPTDTHPGRMDFRSNVPGTWGVTNYKACAGSNWDWGRFRPVVSNAGRNAYDPNGLDHCNGLICRNSGRPFVTRLRDVTDGTSNTFAIGESVPEWCRHNWWWWFNATTATCAIYMNYSNQADTQVYMEGDWWHNYGFMSRHATGAHFGMTDGRVRFFHQNMNLTVYRSLSTIQGEEIAGEY